MKYGEASEKYKAGGGEYFNLPNDKDKAEVRFLYDWAAVPINDMDLSEVDCHVVHEIEINGKRRVRECTTQSDCPDCVSGNKARLRMFIQLVNLTSGKVEVWERPASYASRLLDKVSTYGPLCNRPYLVTRLGAKGSKDTKYEIDALDKDGKTLADLPERVDIMGTMLLPAGEDGKKLSESERRVTANRASGARPAIDKANVF